MVKESRILARTSQSQVLCVAASAPSRRTSWPSSSVPRPPLRTSRAKEDWFVPGKSFLECKFICKGVGIDYIRKLYDVRQWALQNHETLNSAMELDLSLAKYFDKLYFEGYTSQYGEKVVAAVMFEVPSMSKHGDHSLVRARRALRGWHRLVPGKQRLPLPWPCLMALVGSLCAEQKVWVAVALIVGFICYLRPGELDQLTHRQLVSPTPGAGPSYQKWGLLLHPSAELRFGKTGTQDEAVLIDRCEWIFPRLAQLARSPHEPHDRLWPFPAGTLQVEFSRHVARLRIGLLGG